MSFSTSHEAYERQRAEPPKTPARRTSESQEQSSTDSPRSARPALHTPQDSYYSATPGTPNPVSSPVASFSSPLFSAQHSRRQSGQVEGVQLARVRSESTSEKLKGVNKKLKTWVGISQEPKTPNEKPPEGPKPARLRKQAKQENPQKQEKTPRDKSVRPSQPNVLDKASTSKLTKFWRSATGSGSGYSPATSPEAAGHPISVATNSDDIPEIFVGPRTPVLPSIPEHSPPRPASLQHEVAMDSSRLAPEPLGGEKKMRAVQDAKDMYQKVRKNCERKNTEMPPYDFIELIGKGQFGRVYKCKDRKTSELVAIKIINTDDVDYSQSVLDKDDTIRDFRKEVATLQQLKDSKAKNVNLIHEAFDLQEQLWIVSDYCTGGSVKTLMRPQPASQPGLEEQYIIPIARELALAIKSVHEIGVIHRDVKCTNVYITEEGEIQLGDFGIVGVLDDQGSKRRTMVGTPHWMSREMLSPAGGNQSAEGYGLEVDIWSFGCTVYEMATGLPPNARRPQESLSTILLQAPRLEGGNYSQELRDFVAFCLNSDPKERPTADAVLKHPYIAGTQKKYPTATLVTLIHRFKAWEYGGGWRQSLFYPGGAPPVSGTGDQGEYSDEDFNDWNFNTSDSFNVEFDKRYSQMFTSGDPQDVHVDRSTGIELPPIITTDFTPFEKAQQELSANRGEKSLFRLFSPDSAPYELHAPVDEPRPISDLPFRNIPGAAGARESHVVIDLDSVNEVYAGGETMAFDFGDMPTVKASRSRMSSQDDEDEEGEYQYGQSEEDREKRATMEWKFPTAKRATMDWTFPTSEPKEPTDPDAEMELPPAGDRGQLPPAFRPTLKHTATEPIGQFRDHIHPARSLEPVSGLPIRDSMRSMIDLDLPELDIGEEIEMARPSTAVSATGSAMTDMTSGNPFDLEEDPVQNEIDRNRFSYHRQYRSEGGQMRRSSHRSMPMHARGSSMSSTEPDMQRGLGVDTDDDVVNYEYNRQLSEGLGHRLLNPPPGYERDPDMESIDLNTWPDFGPNSGFDRVPGYTDWVRESIRERQLEANGRAGEASGQGAIEFPQITAPHPDALQENADPRLVQAELDRMLDDLNGSLRATSTAFQQHTGVSIDDEEDNESEGGLESSGPTTGDENDSY